MDAPQSAMPPATEGLVDLLATASLTDQTALNLLKADMFQMVGESGLSVECVIEFYDFKITAVLLPAIRRLRQH